VKPSGMAAFLERQFKLAERGTTPRTELLAGVTTFLAMAYIIAVNPAILSQAGMPIAAVAAATCFAAGFATILMGLSANIPLALAPGMGLNAYFTFTVVKQLGVPWEVGLGCVFLSGIAFLFLTLTGVRQVIISALPRFMFPAIAGGIGLFITFIGLHNAGIVAAHPATLVTLGDLSAPGAALALIGLVLIVALHLWKVQGAVLIGILAITGLAWALGHVSTTAQPYDITALADVAFKLDIPGVFAPSAALGLLEIVFVFLFVDLFDNIGTLVGVAKRANLVKPDGTIERLNRILFVDATATVVGAMAGTSTVTSYVESAAGVQAGGRTGLTAVVTGILFLLAMLAAPYAQFIPIYATAPALILVGGLMMAPMVEIAWDDFMVSIPAFLTLVMIPLTFSIANGLAFGILAYALLKLLSGRIQKTDWLLLLLAALFLIRFAYLGAG
jgi:AGZA family xanthine/uracil permease-like MFS transporter